MKSLEPLGICILKTSRICSQTQGNPGFPSIFDAKERILAREFSPKVRILMLCISVWFIFKR